MKKEKKLFSACSKFIKALMVMLLLGSMSLEASDKVEMEEIRHAVRILNNIDNDQTVEWALDLLRRAADSDTCAYAMNCLGLAYLTGTGLEKDSVIAKDWFEKAGSNGYYEAYHNLGMMYKSGRYGIRQDFAKAYDAFVRGSDKGSFVCKYDAGFMLYKGLGCHQDYNKAIALFEEAAEFNHSPSLYMLGLCYRNGYGVEQDTARASIYLNRSAMLSFGPALEELSRTEPENYLHEHYVTGNEYDNVPFSMPEIKTEQNDTSLIYGSHQGFIVMYDWSGQYILGEKPVLLNINDAGNGNAYGEMILSNDTIPFKAVITSDGRVLFSEGNVKLKERYNSGEKINYKMDNAILDIWNNKIYGRLNLYSLKLKEPERPMYIELSRNNRTGYEVQDNGYPSNIHIYPNPFAQEFDAVFDLVKPSKVQVRIFDQSGKMVYNRGLGMLLEGKQTIKLYPSIKEGTYVLNIKADEVVLRTIIVKKGGAK